MERRDVDLRVLILATAGGWLAWFVYGVWPIDLLPDLIPFIGWVDDLLTTAGVAGLTAYTSTELWRRRGEIGRLAQPKASAREVMDAVAYEPLPVDEIRKM